MADEASATSQVSSDLEVQSASLECSNGTPLSKADQSAMSFDEEEDYARDGMITFLTDPDVAIEHFREGMRRGASPLIHYSYAFGIFIRGMLSFNEQQLDESSKVLEAAGLQCRYFRKRMPKGSARRVYYAVLQNDCELYQSFLHFMKETMAGYIKGGLGIRKAWKAYSKVYRKCEKLFTSRSPINPPFSDPDAVTEESEAIKSLLAEDTDVSSPVGLVDLELTPSDENRVRRAVYMGYGSFHVMLSLIPQKFLKLANILGFQGDRRFGLECWQFALTGSDMREPLAAINLLWFHTLLIPFVSLSGFPADPKLLEEHRSILSHLTSLSPHSPLARYFSGRISLMARDLECAMSEYQLCKGGDFFPREMIQIACHERAYVSMLRGDFESALTEVQIILDSGTRLQSTYLLLSGLLTGYMADARDALKLFETGAKPGTSRPHPQEKFSMRRCGHYTTQGVTYVGMHVALLETLYMVNAFIHCTPDILATNLESVQASVASATDPLARCLGLLSQGSILKYLGCPHEAEESFKAVLSCGAKSLKTDKHIFVYANIEMAILARTHHRNADQSFSFLHTARDKFGDYDFDGRLQLTINRELLLTKQFKQQIKLEK